MIDQPRLQALCYTRLHWLHSCIPKLSLTRVRKLQKQHHSSEMFCSAAKACCANWHIDMGCNRHTCPVRGLWKTSLASRYGGACFGSGWTWCANVGGWKRCVRFARGACKLGVHSCYPTYVCRSAEPGDVATTAAISHRFSFCREE